MKIKFPSKDWSERLGITLHNSWGLTNQQFLQDKLLEDPGRITHSTFVDKFYNWLTTNNPELKNITVKHYIDKYNIVLGCISQFNFHDIKYFVDVEMAARPKELKERSDRVEKNLINIFDKGDYSTGLFWILSKKTVDLIENWLSERYENELHRRVA